MYEVCCIGIEMFEGGCLICCYVGIVYQVDDGCVEVDIDFNMFQVFDVKELCGWMLLIYMLCWVLCIMFEIIGVCVECL